MTTTLERLQKRDAEIREAIEDGRQNRGAVETYSGPCDATGMKMWRGALEAFYDAVPAVKLPSAEQRRLELAIAVAVGFAQGDRPFGDDEVA